MPRRLSVPTDEDAPAVEEDEAEREGGPPLGVRRGTGSPSRSSSWSDRSAANGSSANELTSSNGSRRSETPGVKMGRRASEEEDGGSDGSSRIEDVVVGRAEDEDEAEPAHWEEREGCMLVDEEPASWGRRTRDEGGEGEAREGRAGEWEARALEHRERRSARRSRHHG